MKIGIVAAWVTAVFLVAACSDVQSDEKSALGSDTAKSPGTIAGVAVLLDATTYAPGDTAHATIDNGTAGEILFAFVCDGFVDGEVDDEWLAVYEPDCSRIRVRPTRLAGGESITLPLVLAHLVPEPGRYAAYRVRLRFQVTGSDAGYGTVNSVPFKLTNR